MGIPLSQAIEGFTLAKQVSGCSSYTIRNYTLALRRLADFFSPNDPLLGSITQEHIRRFLHQLQTTTVTPPGVAPRPARRLSAKTILNVHTALSSLWSWAVSEDYAETNIVRLVSPPKPKAPSIEPLREDQTKAILRACEHSAAWQERSHIRSKRPEL